MGNYFLDTQYFANTISHEHRTGLKFYKCHLMGAFSRKKVFRWWKKSRKVGDVFSL